MPPSSFTVQAPINLTIKTGITFVGSEIGNHRLFNMSQYVLRLPDLGIDGPAITLSVWLARRGSRVHEGEPLVEVLCGVVSVDLPSPIDGILMEKLAAEDEILVVGQTLAILEEAVFY